MNIVRLHHSANCDDLSVLGHLDEVAFFFGNAVVVDAAYS
jgi:hypothetical protein